MTTTAGKSPYASGALSSAQLGVAALLPGIVVALLLGIALSLTTSVSSERSWWLVMLARPDGLSMTRRPHFRWAHRILGGSRDAGNRGTYAIGATGER
jgi:hypothetical protein